MAKRWQRSVWQRRRYLTRPRTVGRAEPEGGTDACEEPSPRAPGERASDSAAPAERAGEAVGLAADEEIPGAPERVIDVERYRVLPGGTVTLGDYDPDETDGLTKKRARRLLRRLGQRLNALQELLYATAEHALLVVLQGMDTSGKDGVIKRVVGTMNPQGFRVTSFKVPTSEELAHDFLWRVHREAPRRGMVGAFNRSHYEDVLVGRVEDLVPEPVWRARYEAIRPFERILTADRTVIVKFFLYISRDEQRERLQERLEDPTAHWKFRAGDLETRERWSDYMAAYEAAMEETSTDGAPWYVVPANRKWYRDLVVAQTLVDRLEALGMRWPPLEPGARGLVVE